MLFVPECRRWEWCSTAVAPAAFRLARLCERAVASVCQGLLNRGRDGAAGAKRRWTARCAEPNAPFRVTRGGGSGTPATSAMREQTMHDSGSIPVLEKLGQPVLMVNQKLPWAYCQALRSRLRPSLSSSQWRSIYGNLSAGLRMRTLTALPG